MLDCRRDQNTEVGQQIMELLKATREVGDIVPALQHHCLELCDNVLTEVCEFGMDAAVIAQRLSAELEPHKRQTQRWYSAIAEGRSLGKLPLDNASSARVVEILADIGFDPDSVPELRDESFRAIGALRQQESDAMASVLVTQLGGTVAGASYAWSIIQGMKILHENVLDALAVSTALGDATAESAQSYVADATSDLLLRTMDPQVQKMALARLLRLDESQKTVLSVLVQVLTDAPAAEAWQDLSQKIVNGVRVQGLSDSKLVSSCVTLLTGSLIQCKSAWHLISTLKVTDVRVLQALRAATSLTHDTSVQTYLDDHKYLEEEAAAMVAAAITVAEDMVTEVVKGMAVKVATTAVKEENEKGAASVAAIAAMKAEVPKDEEEDAMATESEPEPEPDELLVLEDESDTAMVAKRTKQQLKAQGTEFSALAPAEAQAKVVTQMMAILEQEVLPGSMQYAKELMEIGTGFQAMLLASLQAVTPDEIGSALVWAAQEAAAAQLLRMPAGSLPDDAAKSALHCIREFEERLRSDSALVLGVGFSPLSELKDGAVDPFVIQLETRLQDPEPARLPSRHFCITSARFWTQETH
eukprot:SAG22_NODE_253_length_13622_cov_15.026471_2_plen_586_part_00